MITKRNFCLSDGLLSTFCYKSRWACWHCNGSTIFFFKPAVTFPFHRHMLQIDPLVKQSTLFLHNERIPLNLVICFPLPAGKCFDFWVYILKKWITPRYFLEAHISMIFVYSECWAFYLQLFFMETFKATAGRKRLKRKLSFLPILPPSQ